VDRLGHRVGRRKNLPAETAEHLLQLLRKRDRRVDVD